MTVLVHITQEKTVKAIRRNGIAPTRLRANAGGSSGCDRAVWAFPVLPSYTLTHSWSRELKRYGRHALAKITFRIPDQQPVMARYFSARPIAMSAAEAAGMIRAADDARGYEIMIPRRILPGEILRCQPLGRPMGWRYWPDARGGSMRLCDCPICMPAGEVNARRYRERVRARMAHLGIEPSV